MARDAHRFEDEDELTARFTGGAGARTHALCMEDYRRQRRKLEALNAADEEGDD